MLRDQGFILPAVLFALLVLGLLLGSIQSLAYFSLVRSHERQERVLPKIELQNALILKQKEFEENSLAPPTLPRYFATWGTAVRRGSGQSLVLATKNLVAEFPERKPFWSALRSRVKETRDPCLHWTEEERSTERPSYRARRSCLSLLLPLGGTSLIEGNLQSNALFQLPTPERSRTLAVQGEVSFPAGLSIQSTEAASVLIISIGEISIKKIELAGDAPIDLQLIALSGTIGIEEASDRFESCVEEIAKGRSTKIPSRIFLSAPRGIRYGNIQVEPGKTFGCVPELPRSLWRNSIPLMIGSRDF